MPELLPRALAKQRILVVVSHAASLRQGRPEMRHTLLWADPPTAARPAWAHRVGDGPGGPPGQGFVRGGRRWVQGPSPGSGYPRPGWRRPAGGRDRGARRGVFGSAGPAVSGPCGGAGGGG